MQPYMKQILHFFTHRKSRIVHVFVLEAHKSLVKLHCKKNCDFLLVHIESLRLYTQFTVGFFFIQFRLLLIAWHSNNHNFFVEFKWTAHGVPCADCHLHRIIARIGIGMRNVLLFLVVNGENMQAARVRNMEIYF